MKIVQILDNTVHWVSPWKTFEEIPPFSSDILFIEVTNEVQEGWKWIDNQWLEPKINMPTTIISHEIKLKEISNECEEIIFNGIDVETSQGTKHFSLTTLDQINLTNMLNELQKSINGELTNLNLSDGIPYHSDGELCRFWTPQDFTKIAKSAMDFVFYHQTYCNHLLEYIRQVDESQLNEIYYGINLPSDLQISFMNIINAVSKNE